MDSDNLRERINKAGGTSRTDDAKLADYLWDNADALLIAVEQAEMYQWLRRHFKFANDSMQEIWFDSSICNDGLKEPQELDSSIKKAMAAPERM